MAAIPLFGFGEGQSDQLGRLDIPWGAKIDTPNGQQDSAVTPFSQELIQVLKSLYARDTALASSVNTVINNFNDTILDGDGLTTSVQIPLTFSVSVVGCDVTFSVASYQTLSFQNGLLVGAS